MNKIVVFTLSLSLVLLLVPIAMTNPDISSYDPMADVNRDGIVDVNDLSRLGQAYGSAGLVYQENKTAITVFNENGPVDNARVAIVGSLLATWPEVLEIGYTNSSGITTFSLNSDTNYISIVWGGKTYEYNYANFTTNSLGEASISIALGYPKLPFRYWVFTVINLTTGNPATNVEAVAWENIAGYDNVEQGIELGIYTGTVEAPMGIGIYNAHESLPSLMPIVAWTETGATLEKASGCIVDENGTANVVIYID